MLKNFVNLIGILLICGCTTPNDVDHLAFMTLANRVKELEVQPKIATNTITQTVTNTITVTNTVTIKTIESVPSTLDVPPDTKERKTIWINLHNGSTRPITLRLYNGRWIGEQNEYYSDLPTQRTLEKLYAY